MNVIFIMEAIRRGIAQTQKLKDAEDYSKKLEGISRNTMWFEKRDKFQKRNELGLERKRMDKELQYGRVELLKRRQDRLKRLYEEQSAVFEGELAAMGKAIMKIRP